MKRMLFIHRSVGRNLIRDGGIRTHLEGIDFSDYDQNNDTLTSGGSVITHPDLVFPGNDTKPVSYAEIFDMSSPYHPIRDCIANYDVVIIKSCYPNSNIRSDNELEEVKQ